MSDFFSGGWSIYVGAATVLGLLGCLWLLFIASRRTAMAEDNTTGHVYDEDLVEMNNPLPRWWMVLFILTVLFGLAYLLLYPGLGSHAGQLGWSSRAEYEGEQQAAHAAMAPLYARYAAMPAEQLVSDPQAMAIGERLFINTCAACHGSDARGSLGFPDLTQPAPARLATDTPASIEATIRDGRQGAMPPMAAAVGSAEDVQNVAQYVLSLSGSPHDPIAAAKGKPKFAVCAACHGADGKGNKALGAANLTDKYWLHGWGEQAVVAMVTKGKTNVMPAHAERLSAEQIHVLAAYVWGLSQPAVTPAPLAAEQRQ